MELLLLNMQKHRNFRIDSNRLIILDSSKVKGGMNKLIIIEIWICTSYISRIEFVGKINYDRTINGQVCMYMNIYRLYVYEDKKKIILNLLIISVIEI